MSVLAIAQVEDRANLDKQILKQTVQPDRVTFFVDKNPAKGFDERRRRIAENHTVLKNIVKAYDYDLVWQLEGDCDLPDYCLELLLADYEHLKSKDKNLGYISGIQIGRHGVYAIGAWHIAKDRQTFRSVDYRLRGIKKVDATGFYCLLADRETWLSGESSWNGEGWGPDVNWGLSLEKNIYVDMDLHIGHNIKRGTILPSHDSTCNVHFYKNVNNRWVYKIEQ